MTSRVALVRISDLSPGFNTGLRSMPDFNWGQVTMMEIHVSRGARDRYQFDRNFFSFTSIVVFPNVSASREFADR
jgi:hypothetical protein